MNVTANDLETVTAPGARLHPARSAVAQNPRQRRQEKKRGAMPVREGLIGTQSRPATRRLRVL
ncbi:MAG TPA: hypothetical protein DCG12_07200 [Planctomycetaceae bacterium]|nr:hypothetical protein [Planctomycetaceae bacterium]